MAIATQYQGGRDYGRDAFSRHEADRAHVENGGRDMSSTQERGSMKWEEGITTKILSELEKNREASLLTNEVEALLNKSGMATLASSTQEADLATLTKLLNILRAAHEWMDAVSTQKNLEAVQKMNAAYLDQLEAYTKFGDEQAAKLHEIRTKAASANEVKKALWLGFCATLFCVATLFSAGTGMVAFASLSLAGAALNYKNVSLSKKINDCVKTLFVKTGLEKTLVNAGVVSKRKHAQIMQAMTGLVGTMLVVPALLDHGFLFKWWNGSLETLGVEKRVAQKIAETLTAVTVVAVMCAGLESEQAGGLITKMMGKASDGVRGIHATLSGGPSAVKAAFSSGVTKLTQLPGVLATQLSANASPISMQVGKVIWFLELGAQATESGGNILVLYYRRELAEIDADVKVSNESIRVVRQRLAKLHERTKEEVKRLEALVSAQIERQGIWTQTRMTQGRNIDPHII